MIRVQQADFDIATEIHALQTLATNCGAIVSFTGLVREFGKDSRIQAMTLQHYPGMTEKALQHIASQACQRWSLGGVRVIHRIGKLQAGDNIVLVVTASIHRKDAFEAAQYIMDYLKTDAPFWKKEHTDHGDQWVAEKQTDHDAKAGWQ